MHALFDDKSQCCGCGTCAIVCPTGAIRMTPMELGALYPVVEADKCVDCQRCFNACAYQSSVVEDIPSGKAYVAAAEQKQLLKKSASGGVFATLASAVLDDGGAVFGCSMELKNGVLTPIHICVESHDELEKMQGSKYVQSDLGGTFLRIKQLLKEQRTILFSGTPCQVDALKKYVASCDTSNLYTIDLICHGVPSAKLFQEYLQELSEKQILDFKFRDKTLGWGLNAKYAYLNRNGKQKERMLPVGTSSYYSYFLASETYRQSCYTCKYANVNRVGDITIGDFWGVESVHPEYLLENGGVFCPEEGISAILVNTPKGDLLIERFGQKLQCEKSSVERIKENNKQLSAPSVCSNIRQSIIETYDEKGYCGVERLFRKTLGIRFWVRLVKRKLKEIRLNIARG